MNKIYQDSKDVYVSATIIYAYNGYAYTDAEHTEKFTTSALLDAFLKGAVIFLAENTYATPIGYGEDSSVGSVSYIVPNSTTATSADIATIAGVADPQ